MEMIYVTSGLAVLSTAVTIYNHFLAQSINLAMSQLRQEIAEAKTRDVEQRSKERDELRTWINGSFLRAREVEVQFGNINRRLEDAEHRLGNWTSGDTKKA